MTKEQLDLSDPEFLISRYIDGDLTDTERRRVEDALRDEPDFASLFESYRRTDRWIKALRDTGPELDWEGFVTESRRRRHAAARSRLFVLYRLSGPLAAAAAVALTFTAYFLHIRDTSGPAEPAPRVMVQFSRPVGTMTAASAQRVVTVRLDRTPPKGYSGAPSADRSYAIASAGAMPFSAIEATEESTLEF